MITNNIFLFYSTVRTVHEEPVATDEGYADTPVKHDRDGLSRGQPRRDTTLAFPQSEYRNNSNHQAVPLGVQEGCTQA